MRSVTWRALSIRPYHLHGRDVHAVHIGPRRHRFDLRLRVLAQADIKSNVGVYTP